jgi:predicted ATP-binding protein involved in virulence
MGETKTSEKGKDDVFITDLTIHKVRHLKDIHIPLSKDERKHLILTGKNGSGKTSVLESLWNYFLQIIKDYEEFSKTKQNIHIEFNHKKPLDELRTFLTNYSVLAFFEARRLSDMKHSQGVNKKDFRIFYEINQKPGNDFLQYIVKLHADKSFAKEAKDQKTVKNIENWFEMFENSLKEIFEDKSLRLEFDRKNYNFSIIQKGKEPFGLNTLADGYSAIINVVADLILRMEINKTKSYDVQGVVLIDELETHLHIDLQKKIFPFLTRFFPRVQFIVTTHSPFVLSSIENVVIYDLEKNLRVSDLSGYAYDGIVEGYFRNDKYSEVAKRSLHTYEQLVNQKKRSKEEEDRMIELRRYLRDIPGSLAPGLKVKFQQIELKRKGKHND